MGHAANTPFRTAPLRPDAPPGREGRLEVIARWGDEVLAVAHLRPGERFALTSRAEALPRGTHALVHPAIDDGAWTFAEHAPDGRCTAWRRAEDGAPAGPVALDDGEAFGQGVGGVSLVARRVRTTDDVPPRELIDARGRAVVAFAVGLLLLLVVGAVSLRVPPFGERWAGEDCTCAARNARALRALMARWPARSVTRPQESVAFARPPLRGRYAIRDNQAPHLTRQQAREQVQSRGIFAALPPCIDEACSPIFADPFAGAVWVECHALGNGRPAYDDGVGSRALTSRVSATAERFMRDEWMTLRGRVAADGRLYALQQTEGSRSFHRLLRALASLRVRRPSRDRAFECYLHV